jgi:hypothetical protein
MQDELNEFFTHFYNVKSFEKKMSSLFLKNKSSKIESNLMRKTTETINQLSQGIEKKSLDQAALIFIQIKTFSNKLYVFKEPIDAKLDEIMNRYIAENGGFEIVGKLGVLLKKDKNGSRILTEHKCFEAHSRSLFNRKTLSQDIEYVIRDIKGDAIDRVKLKESYDLFKKTFDELINDHLKPEIDFNMFKSNLNLLVSSIQLNSYEIEWSEQILEKLPILIGYIFALYTLQNSGQYFQMQGSGQTFLFLPHPAQIISIFRLLGIGYEKGTMHSLKERFGLTQKDLSLKKNLCQIGTGEGKSVTLAVTGVVLAILGFNVYCVCYSDYLSKRDYNKFASLFDQLDLKQFINYGTFNKICEDEINKDGDIRKIVEDVILDGRLNSGESDQKRNAARPRVLLIDEVDVFFSKDFYGNSYRPSLELSDKTISDLIWFVWNERKNEDISLALITESVQYKACCERFKEWSILIKEASKDILTDLKSFESHEYVAKDDKIGYKEQDNIVFDTSYGYKTLFAYFLENEKGTISTASLNRNINILIRLGSFSYAEVPLKFNSILGVTGTLETLSAPEKNIIENVYNIKFKTIIPSCYGRNNLVFLPKSNVLIETEHNHYRVVTQEISHKIVGANPGTKRAVFVVLESQNELKKISKLGRFLAL